MIWIIIISAVVVILALWAIVGARHLKFLRKNIIAQWGEIMDFLRKRADLVPNLVETVRKFGPDHDAMLDELIKERMQAAREYYPGEKKDAYERELTFDLKKVTDLGRLEKEIGRDTNFLELKKEISDLDKAILEKSKLFNELVEKYNREYDLVFLKPLAKIFRFEKADKFEFVD